MKKIIDERGRLFGLINVIDVIVLVVALLVVAMVFIRFTSFGSPLTTGSTVNVQYTLRVPMIRLSTADQMLPGDKLYTQDTNTFMGTIIAVEYQPAQTPDTLLDGSLVMMDVPERYDVFLTVESVCSYNSGRYFAEMRIELGANTTYWLCTKYTTMLATCMEVFPEQ